MTEATQVEPTTIKVTADQWEYPVRPPNYWTVEIDIDGETKELNVSAEWDPETDTLEPGYNMIGGWGESVTFADTGEYAELEADQLKAVKIAIWDKIQSFNLELLADIVRALYRDTCAARKYGDGVLDRWREVPLAERVAASNPDREG
jgi:hypothetical protein